MTVRHFVVLALVLCPMVDGKKPPNVVFIVGDDVGYADFGHFNDKKTITPTIDKLLEQGIFLSDYYTFKICSPSRAAMMTGRYPWAAGFYNMAADTDHCTTNSSSLPELLKPLGYRTHALGKWDVGFMDKKCSPTYRGFDTFFGYYMACEADYWYHGLGGYSGGCKFNVTNSNVGEYPTDLSNSTTNHIQPAAPSLNGTYNTHLLADEAVRLIAAHDRAVPLYMYLAFMAVHDGCGGPDGTPFHGLGKQAPIETVNLYNKTVLDTYKVAGAMYTELDAGISKVIGALQNNQMWEDTVLIFVSDNGGPLDHCTNMPLRGGKHTFLEGGVRVMSFVSGVHHPCVYVQGLSSRSHAVVRDGREWQPPQTGIACHRILARASHGCLNRYKTIPLGIAGGTIPNNTGYREPDALDLWSSILDGSSGPRNEVVHQVENQYSCDVTQPNGGCCSSMRMGEMKLIIGGPGDSRTVEIPEPCTVPPNSGFRAPCPVREFVVGCMFNCGWQSHNCEECFGNTTLKPLVTQTAAQCQAVCAANKKCGAFQWVGPSKLCQLKCPGAVTPGRTQCTLGHTIGHPGGAYVCGPKHNDSSAAPPPPAPPTPWAPECPVPFGKSGGQLEPGTNHARAPSLQGSRHDLLCSPWCLFNLTSDIGEQNDLGANPAYQEIARKIASRLRYHGSTGPMPAYIWPPQSAEWAANQNTFCQASSASGYVEPIDLVSLHQQTRITILDE